MALGQAPGPAAAEPPAAELPVLRLLAIDTHAQRAVIAAEKGAPRVVAVGEAIPGYERDHLRRVLADRVEIEHQPPGSADSTRLWVYRVKTGETHSRVQELSAVPPPDQSGVELRPPTPPDPAEAKRVPRAAAAASISSTGVAASPPPGDGRFVQAPAPTPSPSPSPPPQ
ncbi:MAG TPA: hypothetical protein VN811_01405 [Thermoanaerobaculia bacterium]|nr:hypothetical protein [Thermoanaerobaculia bacterium]